MQCDAQSIHAFRLRLVPMADDNFQLVCLAYKYLSGKDRTLSVSSYVPYLPVYRWTQSQRTSTEYVVEKDRTQTNTGVLNGSFAVV